MTLHQSRRLIPSFTAEPDNQVRALFWGLGADGTVSANKNSIKIIGEETPNYAQGYFVYDSKKSGAMTVSHLRFGARPIHSTYLIQRANFIAVHQFNFLSSYDVLGAAESTAQRLLLNSPYAPARSLGPATALGPGADHSQTASRSTRSMLMRVAKEKQLGNRINTIMQTCFFAISGVLPPDEAIDKIKESIRKTYGKRGEPVVRQNFAAVDAALEHLHEVSGSGSTLLARCDLPRDQCPRGAPEFVQNVTAEIIAGRGDQLPVSAFPVDGTLSGRHSAVGEAQTSRRRFRYGNRISALSVESACSFVRTPRFARRFATE